MAKTRELIQGESDLESFKTKFQSDVLPSWRTMKVRLGEFLVEAAATLSEPFFKALQQWLKTEHQIMFSLQRVSMRIARGEMTDEQAELIPSSIAQNISTENLPDPDQEYTIYSPDAGGVIKKRFRNFTRAEKKVNLTNHGIRIDAGIPSKQHKPFARARANAYRIVGKELVLIVESLRKEVFFPITPKLIQVLQNTIKKVG